MLVLPLQKQIKENSQPFHCVLYLLNLGRQVTAMYHYAGSCTLVIIFFTFYSFFTCLTREV